MKAAIQSIGNHVDNIELMARALDYGKPAKECMAEIERSAKYIRAQLDYLAMTTSADRSKESCKVTVRDWGHTYNARARGVKVNGKTPTANSTSSPELAVSRVASKIWGEGTPITIKKIATVTVDGQQVWEIVKGEAA